MLISNSYIASFIHTPIHHVLPLLDLNFDKLPDFVSKGAEADLGSEYQTNLEKEVKKLKSQH